MNFLLPSTEVWEDFKFLSPKIDQFETTAPSSLETLLSLILVVLFPWNVLLLYSNAALPHLHVAGTSSHNLLLLLHSGTSYMSL